MTGRRFVSGFGANQGSGAFSKPWNVRRKMAIAVIVWGCGLITFLALFGKPDSLREAIANSVALLVASTVGSFIFGATWDNASERRAEVDTMAVNAGIPPTQQGGATVVQQNNPAPVNQAPVQEDGP